MINWEALGEKLDQALNDRKHIVLATHVSADGDGLGSEISFWSFLKERGHEVFMINDDPVPQKYRFLKGTEEILVYDKERCRKLIHEAGLFMVLDNSSPERLGRLLPDVKESSAFTICIDHHATVDPFWNLNCVDDDACFIRVAILQQIVRQQAANLVAAQSLVTVDATSHDRKSVRVRVVGHA